VCSQQFVLLVEQVQHGMKEEGQDVEGSEQGGEMLLAVAEIVFQIVTLRLEGVVILVFHLPPGPSGLNHLGHGVIGKGVAGDKGVVVSHPTVRTAHREFTPVHPQGILPISEGHVVEITVGPGFVDFSRPPVDDERRQVNSLQVVIEGGV